MKEAMHKAVEKARPTAKGKMIIYDHDYQIRSVGTFGEEF